MIRIGTVVIMVDEVIYAPFIVYSMSFIKQENTTGLLSYVLQIPCYLFVPYCKLSYYKMVKYNITIYTT